LIKLVQYLLIFYSVNKKMPIDLIPAGEIIPEVPVSFPGSVSSVGHHETLPSKRGRGRPPGAKNKVKGPAAPAAPVATAVIETPPPISPPEPPPGPPSDAEPSDESEYETETESEYESPPPPPPPRPKRRPPELAVAKPKPKAKRLPRVREETPSPPESPQAAKRRLYGEHRARQTQAINMRKERFALLLDRFMR
jgi:hypothetical protein